MTALLVAALGCSLVFLGRSSLERRLLFYPTHRTADGGLAPWTESGQIIGYAREVPSPQNIWLMLHGNAGQASDRAYALPSFSPEDSVYILEYPGYGKRPGAPSRESLDRAARDAYHVLRVTHPRLPICVVSESIGSGPASMLATLSQPPDKFVLIAPFDKLSLVAEDHFPRFLVRLLLTNDWDNAKALSDYQGPVEIFAAASDAIIPVRHARALAAAISRSKLAIIPGGHNDWSLGGQVKIRNS